MASRPRQSRLVLVPCRQGFTRVSVLRLHLFVPFFLADLHHPAHPSHPCPHGPISRYFERKICLNWVTPSRRLSGRMPQKASRVPALLGRPWLKCLFTRKSRAASVVLMANKARS